MPLYNPVPDSTTTTKGIVQLASGLGGSGSTAAAPKLVVQPVFDYVESGCIWTADAPGSTRLASMSSGVVWLAGKRLTVAAVSNRTFTASRDVYVDFSDNSDGTATITYTDATTNVASSSLAAGSLRNAIVVVGASSIAAASSINQGQEDRVLPIASSIPYAVTDSLGNIICNRSPVPVIVGLRRILSSFTTSSASAVQVTALSVPINVTSAMVGRKLNITLSSGEISNSGVNVSRASIWNGTVASGTQLSQADIDSYVGTAGAPLFCEAVLTPSAAGLITFNAGLLAGANVASIFAASTAPAILKVAMC